MLSLSKYDNGFGPSHFDKLNVTAEKLSIICGLRGLCGEKRKIPPALFSKGGEKPKTRFFAGAQNDNYKDRGGFYRC